MKKEEKKKQRFLAINCKKVKSIIFLILFLSVVLLLIPQKQNGLAWEWVIAPGKYNSIVCDSERNLVTIEDETGKKALFDLQGEMILPFAYDEIQACGEGMIWINQNEKTYYMEENGELLCKDQYETVRPMWDNRGAVLEDGLWGYIDRTGKKVIACQFDKARGFHNGYAAVSMGGKWSLIDAQGNFITDKWYDEVRDYNNGYAAVKEGKKWGFLDESGTLITDRWYDEVRDYQEERAAVMSSGMWGYINENGAACIDLLYDEAGNFSEGKAAVKRADQWAYIDKEGWIVIDYDYYMPVGGLMEYLGEFHDGYAFVSKDEYALMDAQGKLMGCSNSRFFIRGFTYNKKYDLIPGCVYIDDEMREKRYGFMGINGEERIEPVFKWIEAEYGPYAVVYATDEHDAKGRTKGLIRIYEK